MAEFVAVLVENNNRKLVRPLASAFKEQAFLGIGCRQACPVVRLEDECAGGIDGLPSIFVGHGIIEDIGNLGFGRIIIFQVTIRAGAVSRRIDIDGRSSSEALPFQTYLQWAVG
ncbi:MAG TPA: hypothetical protein VK717_02690 [Opitutaceae bacterium]|nr:hypothetical protein [Opitutaceae bacterium]